MNEYLERDSKNITYSLLKIAVFIKQWRLENKSEKDISQITKFGFAAWELISAIYESSWNKLTVKNKMFLKQCFSAQFNKMTTKSSKSSD